MPNIATYYGPGSASTVTPAGTGPGGPSELENFYRELLRRQSMQPQQAPQQQHAYSAAPSRSMGYSNGPDQAAAERYRPEESALDVARRNDAMQELAYKKRLREIDLNPPKKFITGLGITPGWADDTSMLPVSMRPQNAAIGYGPHDSERAENQFQKNSAFNAQIEAQRAKTQNTNLPNNNAYYGRG